MKQHTEALRRSAVMLLGFTKLLPSFDLVFDQGARLQGSDVPPVLHVCRTGGDTRELSGAAASQLDEHIQAFRTGSGAQASSITSCPG